MGRKSDTEGANRGGKGTAAIISFVAGGAEINGPKCARNGATEKKMFCRKWLRGGGSASGAALRSESSNTMEDSSIVGTSRSTYAECGKATANGLRRRFRALETLFTPKLRGY